MLRGLLFRLLIRPRFCCNCQPVTLVVHHARICREAELDPFERVVHLEPVGEHVALADAHILDDGDVPVADALQPEGIPSEAADHVAPGIPRPGLGCRLRGGGKEGRERKFFLIAGRCCRSACRRRWRSSRER